MGVQGSGASSTIAGAAGVAGVAAQVGGGTYLGFKNAGYAGKQFENGEISKGVTSAAGAAAGFGAAGIAAGTIGVSVATGAGLSAGIAAAATNPVGWTLLAVAGIVLAANAIENAMNAHEKAIHGNTEKYQEETKAEMALREQNLTDKLEELKVLKENVKDTENIQDRKDMLVKAGIATEQELANKKYDEISAMTALIDAYTNKTKELTEKENNTFLALQTAVDNEQGNIADKTNQFMDTLTAGWGTNKNAKDLSKDQKSLLLSMSRALKTYGDENANNLTDDQKDLVQKAGRVKTLDDVKEMNDFIDALDWHNNTARTLMSDAVRNGGASTVTETEAGRNILGVDEKYHNRDSNQAAIILSQLREASEKNNKNAVKKYISQLKDAGFTKLEYFGSQRSEVEKLMKNVGINEYRTGLDRVPYDGFPTLLHRDEAVLNASVANEVRNLSAVYRDTQNSSVSMQTIIENQTMVLVGKFNELIRALGMKPIETKSMKDDLSKNMLSIKSIKSF